MTTNTNFYFKHFINVVIYINRVKVFDTHCVALKCLINRHPPLMYYLILLIGRMRNLENNFYGTCPAMREMRVTKYLCNTTTAFWSGGLLFSRLQKRERGSSPTMGIQMFI